MKKQIFYLLIFIVHHYSLFAQEWDWTIISNNLNNPNTVGAGGRSLITDDSGNVFMGGNLSDSIALGDIIITSSISEIELLTIKFSPVGQPLWIKHTGGNNNSNNVTGIGLDDSGNSYITGNTNDICYFDTILTNSNGINPSFYIAKINSQGTFEWARVAGRNLLWAYSIGNSITISKQNEIYVAGVFSYELLLQGTQLNTYGGRDIFVAKYDQNGNLQWVKQAGSIYDDTPSSIAVDSNGNCYVTGQIQNNARFGQFTVLTNGTSRDGFITKLDVDGNFLWAKSFGSNQSDNGTSVSYSPMGYLYITGQINGTALFDNIPVQYVGGNDIFIARYDLNGNISFAKGFGGINNENAQNIFINRLGNILVTGEFDGTGVFDTTHLYSLGHTDLFAAEFNYDCSLDWITQYGTDLKDFGYAISADRFDNVFVSGVVGGYTEGPFIVDRSIFLGKIKNPVTPVELASFTLFYTNPNAQLSWSTATELNNHGFEIERSLDKTNWAAIGFREGKGTTSEPQDYSYSDDISEFSSSKLFYRLKQIDFDGSFEYSDIVEVEIAPTKFALQQNYPNPFNPSTDIQYAISSRHFVTIKVYDVLGKEIAILVNEEKPAGNYIVGFNASNIASGIYCYQLRAGNFVETKKMVLMK